MYMPKDPFRFIIINFVIYKIMISRKIVTYVNEV